MPAQTKYSGHHQLPRLRRKRGYEVKTGTGFRTAAEQLNRTFLEEFVLIVIQVGSAQTAALQGILQRKVLFRIFFY